MTTTDGSDSTHYLLGHAEGELERLDTQGRLYREITERAFRDAGIGAGMRVLDIGCGTGDVSLLAASLVGPEGSVLGVDRAEEAIAAARARAATLGVVNATFAARALTDVPEPHGFDALVGRFVLMHQADPGTALAAAARTVRPGGIVVMVESYMELLRSGEHSQPHAPLYDRIIRWKADVVSGAGADLRAGGRLKATFVEAGLPDPTARLEAPLASGAESPYYDYVERSVRSMLPEARRQGIGGFTTEDVDTLGARLRDEVVALGGTLVVWPVVVAYTRTAPAPGTSAGAGG